MGMCRKMAAIDDHLRSLEDELEIRDGKIEQMAHDMSIMLTLFSKFEKRVARTEHRTQHQAKSLKHLTNATTTKQDELASRLQNLSNTTTTKQDELASTLQNLSKSAKQEMSVTSSKQEELARMLQNLSNSTKQEISAEVKQWLDYKVSITIFILLWMTSSDVTGCVHLSLFYVR